MRSKKIQELEDKIDAKSKALSQAIKSHINKKQAKLSQNLDSYLKHETLNLRRIATKVIKNTEEKRKEYNCMIEKLKQKVASLSSKIEKLVEESQKFDCNAVKAMLDDEIKGVISKYENIKIQQEAAYRKEFASLEKNCNKISIKEASKLKNLL